MKTIRASVHEDIAERRTIEVEVEDDFDTSNTEAVEAALEEAFVQGDFREIPKSSGVSVEERYFFDIEVRQ